MRIFLLLVIGFSTFHASSAYANWMKDIFLMAQQIYGVNFDSLQVEHQEVDALNHLNDINKSQYEEMSSIKDLNQTRNDQLSSILGGLTGTHDYGSQFHDPKLYDWGNDANKWQSVLDIVKNGSASQLGQIVKSMQHDFPIADNISDREVENKYYLLQAQNSVASRASAELAFQQMANSEKTLDKLQGQIDKTKDNKSSTDLNNRLSAEHNNIDIEQTKLLAILVSQSAIESQERVNAKKINAEFIKE